MDRTKIERFYDGEAEDYYTEREGLSDVARRGAALVFSSISVGGENLLDVASGPMTSISPFLPYFNQVVCVDLSSRALAHGLRMKGNSKITACKCSADALPFKSSTFDFVTCFGGVHLMPRVVFQGFLSEARRVLKRGGKLVVTLHQRTIKTMLNNIFGLTKDYCYSEREISRFFTLLLVSTFDVNRTIKIVIGVKRVD